MGNLQTYSCIVDPFQVCKNPETTSTSSPSKKKSGSGEFDDVSRACFGAGCYWGTEKFFKHTYPGWRSVVDGEVGFMGPLTAKANPSYEEVCRGDTGHVEVLELTYQGGDQTFEELVRFFFQFHDPTTPARQGNDKGSQYSSVIYYYTPQQKMIAMKVKAELQDLINNGKIDCFVEKNVCTEITKATVFYAAQDEHQEYLMKNPRGYCNHRLRFKAWPDQMQLVDQ